MEKTAVALIPAREGSKSIPDKNLATLGKHSLVGHAVLQCIESNVFNDIYVSTDGQNIAKEGLKHGAKVHRRSKMLASDTSLVIDTVKQFISELNNKATSKTPDFLALIEPTTPLRTPQNIIDCMKLICEGGYDSVATFRHAALNPNRAWKLHKGRPTPYFDQSDPWSPRQKLEPSYQLSGSVYILDLNKFNDQTESLLFGHSGALIVDEKISVDIDNQLDLDFVRFIHERQN